PGVLVRVPTWTESPPGAERAAHGADDAMRELDPGCRFPQVLRLGQPRVALADDRAPGRRPTDSQAHTPVAGGRRARRGGMVLDRSGNPPGFEYQPVTSQRLLALRPGPVGPSVAGAPRAWSDDHRALRRRLRDGLSVRRRRTSNDGGASPTCGRVRPHTPR